MYSLEINQITDDVSHRHSNKDLTRRVVYWLIRKQVLRYASVDGGGINISGSMMLPPPAPTESKRKFYDLSPESIEEILATDPSPFSSSFHLRGHLDGKREMTAVLLDEVGKLPWMESHPRHGQSTKTLPLQEVKDWSDFGWDNRFSVWIKKYGAACFGGAAGATVTILFNVFRPAPAPAPINITVPPPPAAVAPAPPPAAPLTPPPVVAPQPVPVPQAQVPAKTSQPPSSKTTP